MTKKLADHANAADALYLDSSALVKLVLKESESDALAVHVAGRPVITSAIAWTEVPRAVAAIIGEVPVLNDYLRRAKELLEMATIEPLSAMVLQFAGSIIAPRLRSLDAIHVASAVLASLEFPFISYDKRQLEVAERFALMTASPS